MRGTSVLRRPYRVVCGKKPARLLTLGTLFSPRQSVRNLFGQDFGQLFHVLRI